MVEVYSAPGCNGCEGTKKFLDEHGVAYVEHDISKDRQALREVVELNYSSVPVVRNGDDHWSGLNIQKLMSLV